MKKGFSIQVLRLLTVVMILTFCSCNQKQNDYADQLQSLIEQELTDNMPGVLVSINTVGKDFFWSGAAGLSDIQTKEQLQTNQTFRIASVTKTYVAATVLRLWEDGKLSLDDCITKYISETHTEILKSGGYPVDEILIRHLLTHSSGLAEHTSSGKYSDDFLQTRHVWNRTEPVEDLIKYAEPVGEPGEKFSYSDTGYILLGEIIEAITGKSMGDAIAEQLKLKQLGMVDTYMEDFEGDFSGKRIHQYFQGADTYNYHPSMDYYGGGGLLSTTADLCAFYQNLFNHKIFRKKETLKTMLTQVNYKEEQVIDYRMGTWKIELNGKTAYTHSGFWGTQVVYIPEIQTAIAVNYSQKWANGGVAPVISKVLEVIEKK